MLDPLWYETLPEDVWAWYETIKAQSTEIVSLTIRVRRGQISMDIVDQQGKPRRAKFFLDPDKRQAEFSKSAVLPPISKAQSLTG